MAPALERAHQLDGPDRPHLERAGDAQQVIPVLGDEGRVEAVVGHAVERAVLYRAVQAGRLKTVTTATGPRVVRRTTRVWLRAYPDS